MNIGEREIEQAEAAVRREQASAVARIRGELNHEGSDECVTCGRTIPAARRAALPSACRCIECQEHHERKPRDARLG